MANIIRYNTSYGSTPSNVVIALNQPLTSEHLPTLSAEGYAFLGWTHSNSAGHTASLSERMVIPTTWWALYEDGNYYVTFTANWRTERIPDSGGGGGEVQPLRTDETLSYTNNVLSVNRATVAEKGNKLPITSGAVYEELENIKESIEIPDSDPIDIPVSVGNGGTGLTDVAENNFLIGSGGTSLIEKTPTEVLSLIGAAPAVYEYKGVNGNDCNAYTTDTKIFVMNGVNNPNANSHGFLDVKRYDGVGFVPAAGLGNTNPVVHQKFTQFQGLWTAYRSSIDGGATWSEWEYDNPPMVAGVEYRTTERCNGRVIFKKLIAYNVTAQIGSTSTTTTHSIPHGISGFGQAIRAESWKGNYLFPMLATNGGATNIQQIDATNIYMRLRNDYVGTGNMYISLSYIKTGI